MKKQKKTSSGVAILAEFVNARETIEDMGNQLFTMSELVDSLENISELSAKKYLEKLIVNSMAKIEHDMRKARRIQVALMRKARGELL